jgi:serine/threonine-protein phosphatase 2A regulatory subunit B'
MGYLKAILHSLYSKMVNKRKYIRKALADCFHNLIYNLDRFNGMNELLEILASIISGYSTPLKEEHIRFFKDIIIPLHKVQTSYEYFPSLVKCSILYLTKDNSLAVPLLEGILKYWPFANHNKDYLFLDEIVEVIEFCDIDSLKKVTPRLFRRVATCLSNQFQVAIKAFGLFEDEKFIKIVQRYKQYSFETFVPIVRKLSESHWLEVLKDPLLQLKTILRKIDSVSFDLALESPDKRKYEK